MNHFVRIFLFLCIATSSQAGLCEKSSNRHKQMLGDLDFIANTFEINYAPLDWKSISFGWDLENEKLKAKSLVLGDTPISSKQFQRIIKNFCISTKDYHVVPQFYSTEWATLPFQIQIADGRYFICHIDTQELGATSTSPALSLGDEVLFFDGTPINEYVDAFRLKEVGNNYIGTDQALAEYYLTTRYGSSGHDVPQGTVEITYKPALSNDILVQKLDWDYHLEKISDAGKLNFAKSIAPIKQSTQKDPFHKEFMTPHSKLVKSVKSFKKFDIDSSGMLGSRKSMLPPLGTVLWESEENSEFHAYLFLMDDWEVGGYVRIPSYYVDSDSAALEFAEIIEIFQEVSDVMVIDQFNNGGGLVLYLYALAAMLTDYELDVPMHRVKLTQEDVYYAIKRSKSLESIKNDRMARKKFGDTVEGVYVDYHLAICFQNAHNFIIDQWNAGNMFTDYCYLYGMEKIRPHPEVKYTKPILILTNSLNFSAADFFPAIMQDNKRAKIMGSRTAGAGGYIEKVSFPNLSGIEEIDITASFSKRLDGTPIENFGVTPDIPYEISPNDLQNNYSEYKQNILQELRMLISERTIVK
ncbi:MAG TPA: protease-like activity factor CPAF [Parachlamydiaceae bacterium]|nr:protease-like activity factor CPAF [Parachlamydiaceae bacterium]